MKCSDIPLGQPNQLLVLSRIAGLELWKRALLGVTVLQLKFYYASLWAEGSTTNFKLQCHSLLKTSLQVQSRGKVAAFQPSTNWWSATGPERDSTSNAVLCAWDLVLEYVGSDECDGPPFGRNMGWKSSESSQSIKTIRFAPLVALGSDSWHGTQCFADVGCSKYAVLVR